MTTGYHHGDLKPALLAHAHQLLEKGELDRLSMREMARALGVSHSAAYRHFANKGELLDAVAARGFDEMLSQCESAVKQAGLHPKSRLKACGVAYVRFGKTSPRLLTHMFSAVSTPEASANLQESGAKLFNRLLSLITEGQAQKVFRAGESKTLAHACWALVHGLAVLLSVQIANHAAKDIPLIDAEQAIDTLLDGMAASTPKK